MATVVETVSLELEDVGSEEQHPQHREPLQLRGVLDGEAHFEVTPIIGREYPSARLKEWLTASNSDDLLRDLAITGRFFGCHFCFVRF